MFPQERAFATIELFALDGRSYGRHSCTDGANTIAVGHPPVAPYVLRMIDAHGSRGLRFVVMR